MNLTENIRSALRSIRSNLLRTTLTFLIIAFGIMALVGILTAIESIKNSIYSNFSSMGSNTFTIRKAGTGLRKHGGLREVTEPIHFEEAIQFKERFNFPAIVSLSVRASSIATLKYESKKTNPNITLLGVDENYMRVSGNEMESGRFYSDKESRAGDNVVLIGMDIKSKLFKPSGNAANQFISIGNIRYQVVGVIKSKGSSLVSTADNTALIPLTNAFRNFTSNKNSVTISASVASIGLLNGAVDEATGIMRSIRGLKTNQPDNFDINKSDALANTVISNISYVTLAAQVIGIITLFGAAIGLMNIMLVSVTERTREIGISKALGATKSVIRTQFLCEAIVICQIGGLLGIFLGILAGNGISLLLGGSFIIPWLWIVTGIIFCFIVGIVSGLYPAIKTANLDPIESLRYE